MADILTVWDPLNNVGDWIVSPTLVGEISSAGSAVSDAAGTTLTTSVIVTGNFGLYSGHDLQTAVLISLFTDAEASTDDLTDPNADPRGWWGDDTKQLGSKLWLRMRSKQTQTTLNLVANDIRAALQWMIDDAVCASVDVLTEWSAPGLLGARVTLNRASGATATVAFDWAWSDVRSGGYLPTPPRAAALLPPYSLRLNDAHNSMYI